MHNKNKQILNTEILTETTEIWKTQQLFTNLKELFTTP